jgi:hypothetical protein
MSDSQSSPLWSRNTASVFAEAVDLAAGAQGRAATPSTSPIKSATIGLLRRLATSAFTVLLLAGIAFVAWIA